jgi:hypothetical protein
MDCDQPFNYTLIGGCLDSPIARGYPANLNLPELKEDYMMSFRARLNEYAQIKELRGQKEEADTIRLEWIFL